VQCAIVLQDTFSLLELLPVFGDRGVQGQG
jgi:hypothetical protein